MMPDKPIKYGGMIPTSLLNEIIPKTGRNFEIPYMWVAHRFGWDLTTCSNCHKQRHELHRCFGKEWKINNFPIHCIYCILQHVFCYDGLLCGQCISFGYFDNGKFIGCEQDKDREDGIGNPEFRQKMISVLRFQEGLLHQESILALWAIWRFRKDCPVSWLPRDIVKLIVFFIRGVY